MRWTGVPPSPSTDAGAPLAPLGLARQAIEGGAADMRHRTNIVDREMIGIAGGEKLQRMRQAFVMGRVGPGPSLIDSARFGRGNPFDLAFPDEVRLKLSNASQDRDQEFTNRSGRVDDSAAHIEDDQRHPRSVKIAMVLGFL